MTEPARSRGRRPSRADSPRISLLSPPLPLPPPDAAWLDAPHPALKAWREAGRALALPNAAALRATTLDASGWSDATAALLAAADGGHDQGPIELGGAAWRWSAVPIAGATLFWLTPQHAAAAGRLALVAGIGRVGFFERDLDDGGRGWWDEQAFRLFGLEPAPQAPSWAQVLERVHPDDRARVAAYLRATLARDGRHEIRHRLLLPGGGQRELHALSEIHRDRGGRRLVGVFVDDTEGAVHERAQRAQAEHQARALQLARVSIWRIDLQQRSVTMDATGCEFLGLAPSAAPVPVRDWLARAHPDDLAALLRSAEDALAGDAVVDVETRFAHADGSWRYLLTRRAAERDADGRAVALAGVTIDATRQRVLDLELRVQAERLALATGSAGVGVWDHDVRSGRSFWGEQMYRLRGLEPDDPRDPQAIDRALLEPAARAERDALIARQLHALEPYQYEFALRGADGSVRWLASAGRGVRDASGRVTRIVGLDWDVTQRRLAEAALREAEAAARASRAKSEFLARVSHELRTPLNAILGFGRLALQDPAEPLGPRQRERALRVQTAGQHLLALLDEVLDLSAVEAGTLPIALAPVAVAEAVDQVAAWLRPLAARQRVRLLLAPGPAAVLADRQRLQQVLANLLSNAIKYNRRGGEVRLLLQHLVRDGVDGWRLAVCDTGRGIDAAQRAQLFEPFNRLGAERDAIEGRGIGLATTRLLVQRMGGQLELHSVPGEGSEFALWLPAALPPATGPAATAPPPPAPAQQAPALAPAAEAVAADPPLRTAPAGQAALAPPAVLYIEDNPVNVLIVQELLALRPGLRFASAPDGAGGIALALRDAPALVLLDIHLPDADGYEVLRRLRAAGFAGRCIALSANAMPADIARAHDAGFDDYWTKPVDFDRMLATLDRLAAGWPIAAPGQEH